MADSREQHACIKFCFKLGKIATECYEMLKTAFGEPKLNPLNGKPGVTSTEKCKAMRNKFKSMLVCFFDQKGIVQKEFFFSW